MGPQGKFLQIGNPPSSSRRRAGNTINIETSPTRLTVPDAPGYFM